MPTERLTYRDVQRILAVVDTWREGRARLRQGPLEVAAEFAAAGSAVRARPTQVVRSPAVGNFALTAGWGTADVAGRSVAAGETIGLVRAPTRETPVVAGAAGRLGQMHVAAGQFVEYGQPIAVILPSESRNESCSAAPTDPPPA